MFNMQYLTPQDLRKMAPATQKMPASEENLISTKAFLRHAETLGYKPVFAAQGTAHADVHEPLKSRHLVVAAHDDGSAIVLLNSHTIWRRAWIGMGVHRNTNNFMIGAAVPLQRWKGFEAALTAALAYKADVQIAATALTDWQTPEDFQRRWMAKQFSERAYLKGHKMPLPKELLLDADQLTALNFLYLMLGKAQAGGLHPVPTDSFKYPRKLKPILAPDAMFHAANATFNVGLSALKKYKLGDFEFPKYKDVRERS